MKETSFNVILIRESDRSFKTKNVYSNIIEAV